MGVDHPYEHRAHYNPNGQPCHCPWGWSEDGEHLGSVKESSKLDWLKGRPDMQTPEGQQWLNFLQTPDYKGHTFAEADKMLPWMTREYSKGRVRPSQPGETHRLHYTDRETSPTQPRFLGKMLPGEMIGVQKSLEEMKNRGQGVDVMQHAIHELVPKVEDYQDWKKGHDRQNLGQVEHNFGDGWTMRRLSEPEEFKDEGEQMGHCIGDEEAGYADTSEDGESMFYSLRDHNNIPHTTVQIAPNHWERQGQTSTFPPGPRGEGWEPQLGENAYVEQMYGKQDAPPLPEYERRVNEWLAPHGMSTEREENPEVELWREQQGLPNMFDQQQVMASHTRPLYYRWVYSPQKGVTINSNKETHPALVKYHKDLSGDINDANLTHGFASAIGNGWRITDLAHQPVDDPYIVQQVVRRLNLEDGSQIRSEGAWQPSEYDYSTLHYGLPKEVTQN